VPLVICTTFLFFYWKHFVSDGVFGRRDTPSFGSRASELLPLGPGVLEKVLGRLGLSPGNPWILCPGDVFSCKIAYSLRTVDLSRGCTRHLDPTYIKFFEPPHSSA